MACSQMTLLTTKKVNAASHAHVVATRYDLHIELFHPCLQANAQIHIEFNSNRFEF